METISDRQLTENALIATLVSHCKKMPLLSLTPEDFSDSRNKEIFSVMSSLSVKGESWDFASLYPMVPNDFKAHLNTLTNGDYGWAPSLITYYERNLKADQYRSLVGFVAQTIGDEDPIAFAEEVQHRAAKITTNKSILGIREQSLELMNQWERASQSAGQITGVTSGINVIDNVTWGFNPQRLYILAARPSMGKSALAHNIALNACLSGKRVYIQSLEGSRQQILARMASRISKIPNENLNRGQIREGDWGVLSETLDKISRLPLVVDDTSGLNSTEISHRIRQEHARNPMELIIVDHLQEIQDEAQNRHLAISKALSNLRAVAMNLKVPMIVLCQLSRGVEMVSDKKPTMAHLKESGDIEALADVVMLLYREGYYKPQAKQPKEEAELSFAKNRDGKTGTVFLSWQPDFMKFGDPNSNE